MSKASLIAARHELGIPHPSYDASQEIREMQAYILRGRDRVETRLWAESCRWNSVEEFVASQQTASFSESVEEQEPGLSPAVSPPKPGREFLSPAHTPTRHQLATPYSTPRGPKPIPNRDIMQAVVDVGREIADLNQEIMHLKQNIMGLIRTAHRSNSNPLHITVQAVRLLSFVPWKVVLCTRSYLVSGSRGFAAMLSENKKEFNVQLALRRWLVRNRRLQMTSLSVTKRAL
ncbi:hypothetical protein C8J56DRAFT_884325 [Mycena floridula]|nr:hypothetical protein C8J56DRAFT_884325 [Mycena floridula]